LINGKTYLWVLNDQNKNKNVKNKNSRQNILHGDTLYNIKRKKYKTVCAELEFALVIFDRMLMNLFMEFVLFAHSLDL
jgi:hypothetical protein